MNRKEENKINYSIEDIQKYLEGKLSPSAMHAIEKAALNDEFLADAIEGMDVYKTNEAGNFEKDVEGIRTIIENKGKNKQKTILWKAAAIIVAIVTVIALTFNQDKNVKKAEQLASKNIKPRKEETIIPITSLADTHEEKVTQKSATFSKPSTIITKRLPSPAAASFKKEKIEADSFSPIAETTRPRASAPILHELEGRVPGVVISDERANYTKAFSGTVKDEKGNPIVGATVSVSGTTIGAITNEDGSFAIHDKSGDSTLTILVNSIGYNDQKKKIFLNEPSRNTITLNGSSTARLDEVIVVTGYSTRSKRKKATPEKNIVVENKSEARPVIGWKKFKNYLEENKQFDSLQTLKGRVSVAFKINEKGIPYDLTIEESLSPFYDREAIRLIKEGPLWRLKNSASANITITINIDF